MTFGLSTPPTRAVARFGMQGRPRRLAIWLMLIVAFMLAGPGLAGAAGDLPQFLAKIAPAEIFPGADRLGAAVGEPPVAPVFRGDERLGYVFLNSDFFSSVGYSGKPIHVLLSIGNDGVVRGAKLVKHSEPIVLIGIPERKITAVIDGYIGLDVPARLATQDEHKVDIVSGATVTIMVIDDSILRSSIKVARIHGLGGLKPAPKKPTGPRRQIDMSQTGAVGNWTALAGDGSVRRLELTVGGINGAFEELGDADATARPEPGSPDEIFIDLHAALVTVPTIGKSLLGEDEYRNLEQALEPGRAAILVMGRGRYSFKGSGYVRGGIFDRLQLIQGETSARFRDRDHKRLRAVAAAGAPEFSEVDLFYIPKGATFDPAEPWRLELLVARATGPTRKAYLTFDLGYRPPDKYLKTVAPPLPTATTEAEAAPGADGERPLWQRLWIQKTWQIIILAVAISVLTVAFFFQNTLALYPRALEGFRIVFLIFTLFWIGFYANAQLSVVNVMTFFNSMRTDFHWEYFLMEPLIFVLWCSVAASLLYWGRGAYCGWLCPFGALQELTNRIAKLFRVPQFRVPWGLHERLWPVKYMIFMVLFGISVYSLTLGEQLAEIEPFKTAIVLKFMRSWPYVLFAAVLLAIGLFVERFYCRYLCPLGAALAIPGRLRMFDWLRRYRDCGSPCQRCANDCMVQAIHPEGNINPNECLYCMHCQMLYHNDQLCPVVIARRVRREKNLARAANSKESKEKTPPVAGSTP
jgi:NosR/NirI family nitrous oxide reductase transcriptional regulator